jgi:hypothetical protein
VECFGRGFCKHKGRRRREGRGGEGVSQGHGKTVRHAHSTSRGAGLRGTRSINTESRQRREEGGAEEEMITTQPSLVFVVAALTNARANAHRRHGARARMMPAYDDGGRPRPEGVEQRGLRGFNGGPGKTDKEGEVPPSSHRPPWLTSAEHQRRVMPVCSQTLTVCVYRLVSLPNPGTLPTLIGPPPFHSNPTLVGGIVSLGIDPPHPA